MTALPGTPAIQNAIPMPYFGTTPFAAPGLGLIGGRGDAFGAGHPVASAPRRSGHRGAKATASTTNPRPLPPTRPAPSPIQRPQMPGPQTAAPPQALPRRPGHPACHLGLRWHPVVLVIGLNYLLVTLVLPALDLYYLADPRYGATTIGHVRGLWAVVAALTAAIAWLVVLQRRQLPQLGRTLEQGATSSVLPLLNTASQVGFGAVISRTWRRWYDAVLTVLQPTYWCPCRSR